MVQFSMVYNGHFERKMPSSRQLLTWQSMILVFIDLSIAKPCQEQSVTVVPTTVQFVHEIACTPVEQSMSVPPITVVSVQLPRMICPTYSSAFTKPTNHGLVRAPAWGWQLPNISWRLMGVRSGFRAMRERARLLASACR